MSDWDLPEPPAAMPGEAATGLEIRLFGPMEVRIGPCPLPRLRSRKGLWLLALLALRAGRPVERDWLAGTLWPDDDEAHSRRSLRQSLHDLRLVLGPEAHRLTGDAPRTVQLDVCDAFVDVLAFDAAMARGDLDSLEAALPLYRGPLLEGWLEEWCLEERRRREEAYLAALERLAAAATARREPAAAARYLRLAVSADPYREDLQCALMEALAGSGSPAAALLAYRQFRALLGREMAAEPAAEMMALFRRLREEARQRGRPRVSAPEKGVGQAVSGSRKRSADPTPATRHPTPFPGPRRLPLPLTALIGRDEATREVISRLADARLVTLTGTGGIGKSRLALQVAEELADQYEDGAAFVDLAPLADPRMVPETIRAALGVSEGGTCEAGHGSGDARRETIEVLRQYLSPRHLLLVLDNCEHLLTACAALAGALLCQCPGLRLLATSRQALSLRGETVWRVPSLALPPGDGVGCWVLGVRAGPDPPNTQHPTPNTLLEYAAVRLFVERARAAEASFEMTPHNAPAIVQVCRRLDGIPLAIELAAARARSLSVDEIDARLRDGFELLTAGGPALLPRQQTMATTFDWSWGLLSPVEQTLLRRLSVFAGGWTLAAAVAVCAGGGCRVSGAGRREGGPLPTRHPTAHTRNPDDVIDLLTALVDRSLVVYLPSGSADRVPASTGAEARYRLLEPVRQYAADRLRRVLAAGGRDDWEDMRNRHRDFFLNWAEGIKPKLRGPEQAVWFKRLEAERDNLRAALEWCRSHGDVEKELRLVVALSRFWDTRGHVREGRAHLDAALARMTPDLPYALRVAALVHAGWMAYVQRDYPAAHGYYGQALPIAREHGDPMTTADTVNYLALLVSDEGDFPTARALFEESLALCRAAGPSARLGSVLNNIGSLALRQADYEAARVYMEQSAAWCEEVGDRQLHGLVLLDLSFTDIRQARYVEAHAHCAASLRLLHACGAVVDIPPVLEQMARVAQAQAEPGRAARLLGAAQRLREAAGLPADTSAEHGSAVTAVRQALGAEAFAAALAEGQAMDLEQAVAFALAGSERR